MRFLNKNIKYIGSRKKKIPNSRYLDDTDSK